MLSIHYIRENKEKVIERLEYRFFENAKSAVENLLEIDIEKRKILTELEQFRSQSNKIAKSIGMLMAAGKKDEAEQAKTETSKLKQNIKENEAKLSELDVKIHDQIVQFPNLLHESVPKGKSADDNEVVFQNGIKIELPKNALPHWELAKKHDIIDFELGAKLTGAGFPVYKGKGAILQRALKTFFLTEAFKAGYVEIQPPFLVNQDSAYATGQLPDKEGQMYFTQDNFYLIPTAEVPITNIYRDAILKEDDLPVKNCGYSACFRREAGAYGKDVRGLNRLHQFDKVEIVQIVEPAKSYETLEDMSKYVQSLIQKLELPYRVLLLCSADTGFTSAKTYDMEVYSAAQERWLEVSSVSNFETFQANRLKLRYKDSNKKTTILHTLNGSALAFPRILASILENNQQADGSIKIPEVLLPFTGFETI